MGEKKGKEAADVWKEQRVNLHACIDARPETQTRSYASFASNVIQAATGRHGREQ